MNFFNNLAVIISLIIAILYVLGLLNFVLRHEGSEQCQMTYMFQFPQFIRVRLKTNLEFPQYGLYAYSEGKFTAKAREMKFSGVPVLFIPGNGGSYKQVRSLSSVALRKALNSRQNFHFDFFTTDLNEDLSGLFGGVLELQSQFVNHSIYRILDLYSNVSNPPKTVILIGHSMGGMVALKVLTTRDDAKNVNLIVTLSTPHYRPAVVFDYDVIKFYDDVDKAWNPRQPFLLNKTVVTIGSGYNDILVNTHLTQSSYSDIHVVTTGIPKLWADVPHVVIVWCKQLVLNVVRSLFDSIDAKNLQLHDNSDVRLEVFNHHLVSNSGIKRRYMHQIATVFKVSGGKMIERTKRQDSISLYTSETTWYLIPFRTDDPSYKNIIIEVYNYDEASWIYGCDAIRDKNGKPYCETLTHLTSKSKIAPSTIGKKRLFETNVEEFKELYFEFTHFVVRIPSGAKNVKINYDKFISAIRTTEISIPSLTFRWEKEVFLNTVPKSIKYIVKLSNFDNLNQALSLIITPECEAGNVNYQTVATLKVPWISNDVTGYITHDLRKPMSLLLFSPKSVNISQNETAYLELFLDPSCRFRIKLQSNIMSCIENLVRHYSIMILGNFGAILLLILRFQLYSDKLRCRSIHGVFANAISPLDYLKTSYIVFTLFSSSFINSVLVVPDYITLQRENMDFLALPLILYLCGIGLSYSLATGLWFSVVIGRFVSQKLAIGYLCRRLFGSMTVSEWMFNIVMYFTTAVIFCALLIGYWSSGAVALVLITGFYYFKLVKMYEDYLENLVFAALKFFAKRMFGRFKKSEKSQNSNMKIELSSKSTEPSSLPSIAAKDIDIDIALTSTIETVSIQNPKDEKLTDLEENDNRIEEISKDRKNSDNTDDDFEQIDISAITESYDEYVEQENGVEVISSDANRFARDIKNSSQTVETPVTESTPNKIEEVEIKNDEHVKASNAFNFHFTAFLICLLITSVTIPSALTWARNYGFNKINFNDPSAIPMVMTCVSVMIFWRMEEVRLNLSCGRAISSILYFLAILCTIYSTIRIYRLPYLLAFGLLLVAIHQKFAQEEEEDDEDRVEDIEDQIDENEELVDGNNRQEMAVKPKTD